VSTSTFSVSSSVFPPSLELPFDFSLYPPFYASIPSLPSFSLPPIPSFSPFLSFQALSRKELGAYLSSKNATTTAVPHGAEDVGGQNCAEEETAGHREGVEEGMSVERQDCLEQV